MSNTSFVSFTEHWIDEHFRLWNFPANIVEHHGSEKIIVLNDYYVELTAKFGLEPDQIDWVSDCAPNMVGAARGLKSWAGCVDHRLDNITKIAFNHEGVDRVTKTLRKVATHFNQSSQDKDRLAQQCSSLGMTSIKVEQDVETRWWSTCLMCESILYLQRPLLNIIDTLPSGCYLTTDDFDVVSLLCACLKPFMVAQQMLESGGVTSSLVIPMIGLLRKGLQTVIDNESNTFAAIRSTAVAMMKVFVDKFGDGTRICSFGALGENAREGIRKQPQGFTKNQVLATALDPRTKNLKGIPIAERSEVADLVSRSCFDMHNSKRNLRDAPVEPLHVPQVRQYTDQFEDYLNEEDDGDAAGSSFSAASDSVSRDQFLRDCISREWIEYSSEPKLEMRQIDGKKSDPLAWWRGLRQQKYPLLSALARRVLAIPATSAASERLFSVAGLVVTKKRNSLTGDSVSLLVWLHEAWDVIEEFESFTR